MGDRKHLVFSEVEKLIAVTKGTGLALPACTGTQTSTWGSRPDLIIVPVRIFPGV
jgi:hypothetical protein